MHKKVERAKKRELKMLYSLISHKLDIFVEKALKFKQIFFLGSSFKSGKVRLKFIEGWKRF